MFFKGQYAEVEVACYLVEDGDVMICMDVLEKDVCSSIAAQQWVLFYGVLLSNTNLHPTTMVFVSDLYERLPPPVFPDIVPIGPCPVYYGSLEELEDVTKDEIIQDFWTNLHVLLHSTRTKLYMQGLGTLLRIAHEPMFEQYIRVWGVGILPFVKRVVTLLGSAVPQGRRRAAAILACLTRMVYDTAGTGVAALLKGSIISRKTGVALAKRLVFAEDDVWTKRYCLTTLSNLAHIPDFLVKCRKAVAEVQAAQSVLLHDADTKVGELMEYFDLVVSETVQRMTKDLGGSSVEGVDRLYALYGYTGDTAEAVFGGRATVDALRMGNMIVLKHLVDQYHMPCDLHNTLFFAEAVGDEGTVEWVRIKMVGESEGGKINLSGARGGRTVVWKNAEELEAVSPSPVTT